MDVRQHTSENTCSEAAFSDCGKYRYWLKRRWDTGRLLNFIMLNPSVANEFRNDPTVERCERRARQLGFSAFCVTNIFAWRDTDPKAMKRSKAPEGPENDAVLCAEADRADLVIVAWGTHGAHLGRGPAVQDMLKQSGVEMRHLGLSKHGHPRHPLYIPYHQKPILLDF
ncbi:MAG: DUF1643 domain-containing protein [Roseobacter sp.]